MSERLKDYRIKLQWFVVMAQAYWLPGMILRWICRLGTSRAAHLLMKISGVKAVYARHTHPWSSSFIPGHSDLDLTVVLSRQAAESPERVAAVAHFLEHRRLFYYFLSPDDARMTTQDELARMAAKWPPVEIFVEPRDWTLLAGTDVRQTQSKSLSPSQMPWHPEFNRWWGHILQDYLLLTLPGRENKYHRVFYRGAIKQTAYFMVAQGLVPPEHGSFTDRRLAQWVLNHHPGLSGLLQGLEQSGFWEGGQHAIRERIYHEILRITESFYTSWPQRSLTVEISHSPLAPEEIHAKAYDALATKIEALPELKSRLAGILVYPTPFCYPYFYQADMLLPENLSKKELTALADIIRQEFRGREFESKGHFFSITLAPSSVYHSPLVFRGTPFPFLAEHIGQFGRVLFGSVRVTVEAAARQDLVDWCQIFLPFFASNLHRRVEHSSRTLNFSQIAAVRLFLTTGEIVTDPNVLKSRHENVFGEESPSTGIWDYLLRDKPGRGEHDLYLSAASHLHRELQSVEQLLAEQGNQSGEESLR